MSLLNAVLADMIHIVKIILIGDMFFMFRMRENKYKKNRIAIIMLAMFILSIGIYKVWKLHLKYEFQNMNFRLRLYGA